MNHRRGKSQKEIILKSIAVHILPWFLVTLFFCFLFYQVSHLKLAIETNTQQPTETAQTIPKDPCYDLRQEEIFHRKMLGDIRQRYSSLMADIALEIELANRKQIPAVRIMEVLKNYDTTESKMYNKLYGDYSTKKK